MPVSKKHAALVDDAIKRQTKKGLTPASLLLIAQALAALLSLFGYDVTDIIDLFRAKGLPIPPELQAAK